MSEIIELPRYASFYYELGRFAGLKPSAITNDFKGEYLILRTLVVELRKTPLNEEMRVTLTNLERSIALMEENQIKRSLTPR